MAAENRKQKDDIYEAIRKKLMNVSSSVKPDLTKAEAILAANNKQKELEVALEALGRQKASGADVQFT